MPIQWKIKLPNDTWFLLLSITVGMFCNQKFKRNQIMWGMLSALVFYRSSLWLIVIYCLIFCLFFFFFFLKSWSLNEKAAVKEQPWNNFLSSKYKTQHINCLCSILLFKFICRKSVTSSPESFTPIHTHKALNANRSVVYTSIPALVLDLPHASTANQNKLQ